MAGPARTRAFEQLGAWLLLLMGLWCVSAHADLYTALIAYEKGDYTHAFQDFLALAKLGQPLAQLDVAYLYQAGQGTQQSDIHAYAWATLAGKNGEAAGAKLAGKIRSALAPGSVAIAGWITAPYTAAALSRTLLPLTGVAAKGGGRGGFHSCRQERTRSDRRSPRAGLGSVPAAGAARAVSGRSALVRLSARLPEVNRPRGHPFPRATGHRGRSAASGG